MENAVSLLVVNSRLTLFIRDFSISDKQISLELQLGLFLIDRVGLQQQTLIKRMTPVAEINFFLWGGGQSLLNFRQNFQISDNPPPPLALEKNDPLYSFRFKFQIQIQIHIQI
jgi:hypothetical protein